MTTLHYTPTSPEVGVYLFIGDRGLVSSSLAGSSSVPTGPVEVFNEGKIDIVSTWEKVGDKRVQYVLAHLAKERSRNMGFVRSDLVHEIVGAQTPKEDDVKITLVLESGEQVFPAAWYVVFYAWNVNENVGKNVNRITFGIDALSSAVARAFPLYSRKSSVAKLKPRNVYVDFTVPGGVDEATYKGLNVVTNAIRTAARLVDTPCGDLNVTTYVSEIRSLVSPFPSVTTTVISGEELQQKGLNGVYSVGKAAVNPPALVILTHTPKTAIIAARPVFVGKGIVYDTGGLSLKSGPGMVGMKEDMAGSAACLGAFLTAVELGHEGVFSVVLCLAENAIGSNAQRPDDIIPMLSGKTVEVNNTDAEGRLVLGDGVAYATKYLDPTHVVDIATLTGAQLITTGKKHAGVLSRNADFEKIVLDAGQKTGDWCFPLLYAPEILKKEFDSKIADMRNSVADRMNAQSSCAGHFIEEHLAAEWQGRWAHVDMAGPSAKDQRSTGFGVALLVGILDEIKKN
ncbi:leucyl aminopeptidase [Spizellomyces sp. 'palustris']|nr:leucyl aminopeptidase [Spizellomyces sp. 'palustris']